MKYSTDEPAVGPEVRPAPPPDESDEIEVTPENVVAHFNEFIAYMERFTTTGLTPAEERRLHALLYALVYESRAMHMLVVGYGDDGLVASFSTVDPCNGVLLLKQYRRVPDWMPQPTFLTT